MACEKPDRWFDDPEKILETARFLDEQCYFYETSNVLDFFEKPWKWTNEHEAMLKLQQAIISQEILEDVLDTGKPYTEILTEMAEEGKSNDI